MRSGRSGNVIHAQDRTRWDAWGCAWKSHWEETTVSTLCLQTSIQSFLLFQQKLQAFSAPYWRDRRGQAAICLFHSLYSPWSWSLCFRLFGDSSLMTYSKILEYYCWELCSGLFVVHLFQLVRWIVLSKTLFLNDLRWLNSSYFAVGKDRARQSARVAYSKLMHFISLFKEIKHLNWCAARCFLTVLDRWRLCGWLIRGSCFLKPQQCEKNQTGSSPKQTVVRLHCAWKSYGIFLLFSALVYLTVLRAYKEVKWFKLGRCLNHLGPFWIWAWKAWPLFKLMQECT